jgi:hypothetical protein
MMTIIAGLGVAYLGVAAYAWWFVISTPKIGTRGRPLTFAEKAATARREGWTLGLLALAWFPIAAFAMIRLVKDANK